MDESDVFAPIRLEQNEPFSRAPWEARIAAIWSALNVQQIKDSLVQQTGASSPAPADPALDYFQQRYAQVVELLVASGLITREELESGRPEEGSRMAAPLLTTDDVASWFSSDGHPWKGDTEVESRFKVGQVVCTSGRRPDDQRRCSRYARGRVGIIERDHGVFILPHLTVQRLDDESQHLYSVRFTASQLWGEMHAKDTVVVNMWGDELQAV